MDAELSYLAEFKDKQIEEKYFENNRKSFIKRIKMFLVIAGILYFSFIIPDWFLIHDASLFSQILANRLVIAFLMAVLYKKIGDITSKSTLCLVITVCEIIVSVSFCAIFYQYENPDFLIQAFGLMMIIIIVFVVPNRWIYKNIVALVSFAAFFSLSFFSLKDIEIGELSAAIVYILLVILFSSLNAFSIDHFKRYAYFNNKALELLSNTDPLTGIFNRAKFNAEMEKYMHAHDAESKRFSLIIFDIDDFKEINDHLGHLTGDKVIIELVDTVKQNIRENDMLYRWGGEEFIVFLKDNDTKQAFQVAEKLRKIIEGRMFLGFLHITCSFGVVADMKASSADEILAMGDKYLYMAKAEGKNIVKEA
ncbi:MAG: diguanylate cyclase [Bacillota bacterium]